jgi:hypothetical protein
LLIAFASTTGQSVKNFIVSDFFLPEVAALLGKDARSVRRWCIKGLVKNAVQTPGGHWRIGGQTLEIAAAKVKFAVMKHARGQRIRQTTITGKPIPPPMLERVENMKQKLKKSMRRDMVVLRVMDEMPPEFIPDGVWESPWIADAKTSALAWAMVSDGDFRPGVEAVADRLGIPRRKVYRLFGKNLPAARRAALEMLGIVESTKAAFDSEGDFIAISFPDHSTALERRAWGSGRPKNTVHHDPVHAVGATTRQR